MQIVNCHPGGGNGNNFPFCNFDFAATIDFISDRYLVPISSAALEIDILAFFT